MKLVPILAAMPIGAMCVLATSYVTIRPGPAYDGLTPPIQDCFSKDKTIKAVRIETAIFDDDDRKSVAPPSELLPKQLRMSKPGSTTSMTMGSY